MDAFLLAVGPPHGSFLALPLFQVATVIFSTHVITLLILIVCACIFAFNDNWNTAHASFTHKGPDNPPLAILYGFSSAMLGITGFETTANFVEQQKKGVFAKTLRNMIGLVRAQRIARPLLAFR